MVFSITYTKKQHKSTRAKAAHPMLVKLTPGKRGREPERGLSRTHLSPIGKPQTALVIRHGPVKKNL